VIAGELIKPAPPDQPTKKPGLSPGFLLPSATGALLFSTVVCCFRLCHAQDLMATQAVTVQ